MLTLEEDIVILIFTDTFSGQEKIKIVTISPLDLGILVIINLKIKIMHINMKTIYKFVSTYISNFNKNLI